MKHTLIHGDCLEFLRVNTHQWDMVFADPPDNIGLGYPGYDDNREEDEYLNWLDDCIQIFLEVAPIVWLSFNARWCFALGAIVERMQCEYDLLEVKPCVQTYTFYQHNKRDLGFAHRPLWRFRKDHAPIYSEQIRIPSRRQQNGDKRANPGGKVPGDVFDFPRVVGNSKQRRSFCKTQLHEGLVERCILQSTREGGTVLDPFAGTGTTLRVCKRINRQCTLVEQSELFCKEIAKEHELNVHEV